MNKLIEHIEQSPVVLAAITQAVNDFYYERIMGNNREREELKESRASELLTKLWCLNPGWRKVLIDVSKNYYPSDAKAIPLDSNPDKTILKIELNY